MVLSKLFLPFMATGLALAHYAAAAQPSMYKCIDPVSGASTFQDRPCTSGKQAQLVPGTVAATKKSCASGTMSPLEELLPRVGKAQVEAVKGLLYGVAHGAASGQKLALTGFLDEKGSLHVCTPPYRSRYQQEVDASEVVIDADSRTTKFSAGGSSVLHDPGDAQSVLARCSDLVTSCFEPNRSGHSLDECVAQARTCGPGEGGTEQRPCCPAACKQGYAARRQSGVDSISAFDKALYGQEGTCGRAR